MYSLVRNLQVIPKLESRSLSRRSQDITSMITDGCNGIELALEVFPMGATGNAYIGMILHIKG
jgi:hypothetical protein